MSSLIHRDVDDKDLRTCFSYREEQGSIYVCIYTLSYMYAQKTGIDAEAYKCVSAFQLIGIPKGTGTRQKHIILCLYFYLSALTFGCHRAGRHIRLQNLMLYLIFSLIGLFERTYTLVNNKILICLPKISARWAYIYFLKN